MSLKARSACELSAWGAGSATVSTQPTLFFGIIGEGSAAASTLTVKDGTTTRLTFTIPTTESKALILDTPAAFSTSLTVTNGGTASFGILFAESKVPDAT
jgi:hypothetical protein